MLRSNPSFARGPLSRDLCRSSPQPGVPTRDCVDAADVMALEDRRLSTIVVNNPTDTPVAGQIDLRKAIVQATRPGVPRPSPLTKRCSRRRRRSPERHPAGAERHDRNREDIGPEGGRDGQRGREQPGFLVDPNTVAISGMTITGGNAGIDDGGGLNNSGTLTVSNSAFPATPRRVAAASITSGGRTVSGSTFTSNSSSSATAAASSTPGRDGNRQHLHRKLRRQAAASTITVRRP